VGFTERIPRVDEIPGIPAVLGRENNIATPFFSRGLSPVEIILGELRDLWFGIG